MNNMSPYIPYIPVAPSGGLRGFSKLPLELRHKIFKEHLKTVTGRLIEIKWSKKNRRYYVDTPTPALLHVCHESRALALEHWEVLELPVRVSSVDSITTLSVELGRPLSNPPPPPPPFGQAQVNFFRLYFNFDLDIFYFSSYHFESGEYGDHDQGVATKLKEFLFALNFRHALATRIRVIAFNAEYFNVDVFGRCMYNMKNLQFVHLVFGDICCASERFSYGRGRSHKVAVSVEQIIIPSVPLILPAPPPRLTNPTINLPGFAVPTPGFTLPMHLMPGFPHFNANMWLMAQLSPDDQRKVQIGQHWLKMDDELIRFLEQSVIGVMARSNGHAREDWSKLITRPSFVTRVPVRPRVQMG